ncbi:MAG: M16 family metallopeptidase, partial [Flavobacterium sp.]
FVFLGYFMVAQNVDLKKSIPNDPSVITGTLKNGLKYYVKHNKKPEKKVDMRLVVKVGSIVEEDKEQGLAHFTEHMAFNGTKKFPKNELVSHLEKMGVKFGADINAYTGFDETVYFLPMPAEDPAYVKTGLEILEEWAFNMTMDGEEIDKERKVIVEEYKTRLGAEKRMQREYLPKLLYKSKYADRLPIGTLDVIENHKHQTIRDFYKNWYRPNLMSIIVVGDIDAKEMEKMIINQFSKYQNPKKQLERKQYDIPNHKESFVSIVDDEEQMFTNIEIMYKDYGVPQKTKTVGDYRKSLVKNMYSTMINNRLAEKQNVANPPFNYGYSFHGSTYSPNKDAYQSFAMTSPDKLLPALKTLAEENLRVKKYGFLPGELERAKKEYLVGLESQLKEKDKSESERFVWMLQENFTSEAPMPDIEWVYNTSKALLPSLKMEEISALINEYLKDDNRVVIIKLPKKEGIVKPTEKEILDVLNTDINTIKAYEEIKVSESLIRNPLAKGSITNKAKNDKTNETTLTLSNGAKVTYKITDFKNDEILMEAMSFGGTNLLNDADYKKLHLAFRGVTEAGVGGMNKNELEKFLSGKIASVNSFVGSMSEGLSGNCAPKDLETMMQLIHVNMVDINKNEEAYNGYVTKQKGMMGSFLQNPNFYFQNEFYTYLNEGNPRFYGIIPTEELWNQTDYNAAYELYKSRFANAADFHFYFVGNINEKEFEDYCATYIASLPATNVKEKASDLPFRMKRGDLKKVVNKGKDQKSNVTIMYYGDATYSSKEAFAMQALGEILSIRLIDEVREKEGGVYSIRARGNMSKMPSGSYSFNIGFPTSPDKVNKLVEICLAEVKKIVDYGPQKVDFDKFLENQKVKNKEDMKKNDHWSSNFRGAFTNDRPSEEIFNYIDKLEKLTLADLQEVAKKYLSKDKTIGILMPE